MLRPPCFLPLCEETHLCLSSTAFRTFTPREERSVCLDRIVASLTFLCVAYITASITQVTLEHTLMPNVELSSTTMAIRGPSSSTPKPTGKTAAKPIQAKCAPYCQPGALSHSRQTGDISRRYISACTPISVLIYSNFAKLYFYKAAHRTSPSFHCFF